MSYASRQFAKQWINHYSRKDTNHHIKGNDTAANRRTLVIVPFSVVIDDRLGDGRMDTFTTTADTEMDLNTAANWDTVIPTDYTVPATRAGKDFYIYACIQAGNIPKILLSANSTYPSGYTANNSRKIGGFHCECVAVGTISGHALTGFLAGDILYRSIWDLRHCANGRQEGTFWCGYDATDGLYGPPIWAAIYLASGTGVNTLSVFGGTISIRNWMDAADDLKSIGARFPTDHEFQAIAYLSNEETNITGSTAPTTAGGASDSASRRMVSNFGAECCCGAGWQWLSDSMFQLAHDATLGASTISAAIVHDDAPGGNPIYMKYDGINPYLCCNMANDAVDKFISIGGTYLVIKHDADASVGGCEVAFATGALPQRRLQVNNTVTARDAYLATVSPGVYVKLEHYGPLSGPYLYFDDGADERLECNNASGSNSVLYPVTIGPDFSNYNLAGAKGSLYRQGGAIDIKIAAGGAHNSSTVAGSRARNLALNRESTAMIRYVVDHKASA